MNHFPVHDIDTAPEASRETLKDVKKRYGFVPNLLGMLSAAPVAVEAYHTLNSIYDNSSLSADERQTVLLTASRMHDCGYCMAAHSTVARMQKVDEAVVEALREGHALTDARLEALRTFTTKVVEQRGWVDEADVQAFLDAGFEAPQVLEVLVGVSLKTLSNYANHLAHTPVDEAFQPQAWRKSA